MKQLQAVIVFVSVNNQLIIDRDHLWGSILSHAMQLDFDAAHTELEYGCRALNSFDHAGRNGREKEFGGIERIGPPSGISIERNLSVFAPGQTAMGINPIGSYSIFEHLLSSFRLFQTVARAIPDATVDGQHRVRRFGFFPSSTLLGCIRP
jgi:hypothetical protein